MFQNLLDEINWSLSMSIPVIIFSDLLCHFGSIRAAEMKDVLVLWVLVWDLRDPRSVSLPAMDFVSDLGQVT